MDTDSPDDYEPPPDRIPNRAPERAPVDIPRQISRPPGSQRGETTLRVPESAPAVSTARPAEANAQTARYARSPVPIPSNQESSISAAASFRWRRNSLPC